MERYYRQNSNYFYNIWQSPDKYHGLFNQGSTCYLNSVLQVLFMTEDFREAVKRHTCDHPQSDCIDPYLTSLFDDLTRCKTDTNKITNKLGIRRENGQQDAAEYFEKILNLTSPEASQIFHGELTHKTTCSARGHVTEADGKFWLLPLELVDSYSENYSVVNGIKEYFRVSHFSGENQMYCEGCDAKCDATTKCVVKHHPEVLMLLLKRFEFDYNYMTYVKVNCTVDVPSTLQIPENQTYELYAFVEHFGNLRGGHYTATIKSQEDGNWYLFNDTNVTKLGYQPFQLGNFEKCPYLLFYRKVHAADTCTQDISTPGELSPATISNNDKSQDARAEEASDDTAVAVSVETNEDTGSKDIASVDSRRLGQSSDVSYHFQDEKQGDERKKMTDDEEDMRGSTGERETLSRQTQPEECDQNIDRRRPDGVSHDLKPEVCDRQAINGHLNKQDERSGAQRRILNAETYKDRKNDEEEQSEKKENSLMKYHIMDAEHQGNKGLDNVIQSRNEGLVDNQKNGQDYGLKTVSADKQGDGLKIEKDVNVDKEGKTRAKGGTHKDAAVKKQAKEQEENGENELIQRVADSSHRQAGLAGSRRVTENKGAGSVEKMRQGNSHLKARAGFNEGTVEGGHGTKQSEIRVKIIDEEITNGIQIIVETEYTINPVERTSQQDILTKGVCNLNLSESVLQKPQKRGTKRDIGNVQEENTTNCTNHSNSEKRQKIADSQEPSAEMNRSSGQQNLSKETSESD